LTGRDSHRLLLQTISPTTSVSKRINERAKNISDETKRDAENVKQESSIASNFAID